jgi:hypothetical protein
MWQAHEGKVVALTRGGLAGVAGKRDGKTSHSDNPRSDAGMNCKKSAEVIVPAYAGKDRTIVVLETRGW